MITYELLPDYAKKAYKRTDLLRKISGIAAWIFTLLVFIYMLKMPDHNFVTLLIALVFSFFLGCSLHGLVHFGFTLKKMFSQNILIGLIALNLLLIASQFTGGIHLIIDTIRFIQKKPLIRDSELHHFVHEIPVVYQTYDVTPTEYSAEPTRTTTAQDKLTSDLQTLKSLYEQGLITEDEYNKKKSTLLDSI